LHIVADGLGVMEFGNFVPDCVGVLAGGEAVDDEGVTLGEDPVVQGTGLLGGHDQREAGAAALPYPFNEWSGAGLGVTGRCEKVSLIEEQPDQREVDLGVFAFDFLDFFPAAVKAPLVVHLLDEDAGEHGPDVPRQGTGTGEVEDDEFPALDDFLDLRAGGAEDTPVFSLLQAAVEGILDVRRFR
jgi:hypothetical protein